MSTDLFLKYFFWLHFSGSGPTDGPILIYPNEDGVPNISIPTFAMASYKLKGSIWMKKGVGECQAMNSLLQAADDWLRLAQVNHPDYQFFKSHGTYYRWTELGDMSVPFLWLKKLLISVFIAWCKLYKSPSIYIDCDGMGTA